MTDAAALPVARVLPLLKIAHLDREFEYLVTADQDQAAQPGVRVRIRFAGRLCDAIVLERTAKAEHEGKLAYLKAVISPEVVVPPATMRLVNSIAQRYAGTRSEMLRSVIPPRHARAESQPMQPWKPLDAAELPDLAPWQRYEYADSFIQAVLAGQGPRAAWQILPAENWADTLARLALQVVAGDGGVLIVVPDQDQVDYLEAAFRAYVPAQAVTTYTTHLGPQTRYRRYLHIAHGEGRLVIGTRAASFAPVANLQLAVIIDDGNENLVDRRAPYFHAREVLTTRSALEDCALLIGNFSRTAETQLLVNTSWCHNLVASREVLRQAMPHIQAVADSNYALERDPLARQSRIPAVVFQAVRQALENKQPVLFQVPRKGYVPTLQCAQCRNPARCRQCNGPLALNNKQQGYCRWCGRIETHFQCQECGSSQLRALVLGAQRTAEEIGRAFPKIRIQNSSDARILREIESAATIVVATPGAAPRVVDGGYGAVVFLDTWAQLQWPDLRAGENTLQNWMQVSSLASSDGQVIVVADPSIRQVQALIRWDPIGAAQRDLEERANAGFPPARYLAVLDGSSTSLHALMEQTSWGEDMEVLGPVELPVGVKPPGGYDAAQFGPAQRVMVRAPLAQRKELAELLLQLRVQKSIQKDEIPLRVQVDPIDVG